MTELRGIGPRGALSAEQLEYAARIGEFWERRVLSTERCDRHDVRYLVDRVYQAFGFSPPSTVTRVDSPVAGIAHVMRLAADHRHLGPHMGKDLRDDLDDQLERMLLDEGSRTLDERIWRALGARARLGQGTELDQPMWRQIVRQLDAAAVVHKEDRLADPLASWYCSELSAWWDGVWLARLICETTFAGISDTSRLTAVAALTAAVGCWWPMDGAVVVVERPTVIRCDAMGCLHGEDGPALIFADGYAVYAWHGTAVPADMIHGESWSVARILAERNLEVRRCAAEHMGWGEFLTRAGAQLVAEAPDPGNAPHRLELYDLPDEILEAYPRDVRVCLCTNGSLERDGSARRYGIVVRADLDDPVEAIADSYGVSAEVYRGLQARR